MELESIAVKYRMSAKYARQYQVNHSEITAHSEGKRHWLHFDIFNCDLMSFFLTLQYLDP